MPLSGYFGGHGEKVMADLVAKHGKEEGERAFYAIHNTVKKKEALKRAAGPLRKK